MDNTKTTFRLNFGDALHGSNSIGLRLDHANDQHSGDDYLGGRNWSIMLVLFAAMAGVGAGIPAIWSLS